MCLLTLKKIMKINSVQIIKERLTMFDVCEKYGFELNRADFICCPFHIEKTPSMKIYKGDRGYHCFGCGVSGDIISFVQRLFNLSFQDTLQKIDIDFCLSIYGNKSFEQLRQMHYKQRTFEAQRERKKQEQADKESEYWKAFDEWQRLVDNFKKYKPTSENEPLNPLFVEALQKIEQAIFELEQKEIERRRMPNE